MQRRGEADARWDRLIDQRVQCRHANGAEHLVLRAAVGANVSVLEQIEIRRARIQSRCVFHLVSSVYAPASSSPSCPPVTLSAIIHEPCGSLFTCSGCCTRSPCTSVTSPSTGL